MTSSQAHLLMLRNQIRDGALEAERLINRPVLPEGWLEMLDRELWIPVPGLMQDLDADYAAVERHVCREGYDAGCSFCVDKRVQAARRPG